MSKLTLGITAVVAVAGAGAIFIQQQSLAELRGEIALLREEGQRMSTEWERMRREEAKARQVSAVAGTSGAAAAGPEAREVAALREEVNALKKSAQEFGRVIQAAQAKSAESSIPTKLVPMAELKNGGRATASAAIETVLWAATGGEVDVLAQGIGFTPTAKAKAEAWFAQLSDATKAQYGSPEKLIALMIAKDAAAVSGMQVLGQREITADDVGMRVRFGTEDGKTKDDSFLLHRSPTNGWQLVLSDPVVEKFAKQVAGGGK